MTTAIFIILCVILILMFAIYDKICEKNNTNVSSDESLLVQKEMDAFQKGLQQGWMHVNISLYKMWNELDILDFDSIQSKLQQTIENLANDPKEMKKWAERFKEYLNGRGN